MKQSFIIGNWKSHKTAQDVRQWFIEVASLAHGAGSPIVILCPPYPLLSLCQDLIKKYQLDWKLGAQDVSAFPEGKHTGEVSAALLRSYVDYVLIGHSERRNELHETDSLLFEKVKRVREAGLVPIFFVQDEKTQIADGVDIVAYEPIFAIGTGHADSPEDAEKVGEYLKKVKKISTVLYGGSVNDKNVSLFMSCSSLDGVVPGKASLDPAIFARLIQNA